MWMDQLSIVIGEISILVTYSFSCVFFLSLPADLSEKIEVIAAWTVLGAIGANAVLSVLTTLYSVVTIYKEYKKQVALVQMNLSKIKPTFRDEVTAVRMGLALD